MIHFINKIRNQRALKKLDKLAFKNYDIVQEMTRLTDSGFTQGQALQILNAISGMINAEKHRRK